MDLYELGGNLGITGALPIYWISTVPTGREQVCQEIDTPAQGGRNDSLESLRPP